MRAPGRGKRVNHLRCSPSLPDHSPRNESSFISSSSVACVFERYMGAKDDAATRVAWRGYPPPASRRA